MRRHILNRPFLLALLAVLAATGVALDLLAPNVREWFGDHQFITAMLAEALLLAAIYAGFEYLADEAEARRWRAAAADPLRQLARDAEQMDRKVEALISEDRRNLDRSGGAYQEARAAYGRFKDRVEANQPLLTASPYMVGFLPVCLDLEAYMRYLLNNRPTGKFDDSLYIRWYDRAVWNFIDKFTEAVPIREISDPWLYRIPENAYRRQLRRTQSPADKEFLQKYLEERRSRNLSPPPQLPGEDGQ